METGTGPGQVLNGLRPVIKLGPVPRTVQSLYRSYTQVQEAYQIQGARKIPDNEGFAFVTVQTETDTVGEEVL